MVDIPHKLPERQYPQHSHLPGRDRLIKAGVKDVLELCIADVESLRHKQELVGKLLHTGSPLPKRKEPSVLSCHLMSGGTEDGNRKMPIILLSPLLVGSFCQGWGEWKRARTQLQKEPCALLSFWLICAKPFAKLSKLHFNHQCNDASIYLTSTCLRRAMSRFISYFGLPRQTQLTLNNRA